MRIPRRPLSLAPVLLFSTAAILAAVTASSAPPAPSQAPSGAPTAFTSATATASSKAAPDPLPQLRGADIPTEKSDAPKNKEWAAGKKVRPHRRTGGPCKYTLVREWLRIECDGIIGGTLVAVDPTDVKLVAGGGPWVEPDPQNPRYPEDGLATTKPPAKTLITMRLRKGETKLFSLLAANFGYFPEPFEMGYVSISWPPHREDPMLLSSIGEL